MSVHRKKGRKTYLFDFVLHGVRHHGTTGVTSKRDAEAFVARYKAELATGRRSERVTMREAAGRWFEEVGKWHADPRTTHKNLQRLTATLGPDTPITDIATSDIATLIAQRRARVQNATVNRMDIAPLRAIWNRAADVWGIQTQHIAWKSLALPEPPERVRELTPDQEAALILAMREDLREVIAFAVLTGLRQGNVFNLRWDQVDIAAMEIRVPVKSQTRKVHEVPIIPEVLELLGRVRGHHETHVFTFVAQRTFREPRSGRQYIKGERYPISRYSFRDRWNAAMEATGIIDFNFHDLRHTFATRILRASDLKVTQKLLGHADISTTARYAHALRDDQRAAMARAAQSRHNPDTHSAERQKPLKRKGK